MFVNQQGYIQFEDGHVPFFIGSDHEARLGLCDTDQLMKLSSWGCNAITATLFGGDMNGQNGRMNIHPFVDRKNPGLGYNADVLQKWKNYFDFWHGLNPMNTKWLMLSEHENHTEFTGNVFLGFYEKMVEVFGDKRTVFYFEEFPFGPREAVTVNDARARYQHLKVRCHQKGALTGYHNPLHIDSYEFLAGEGLIDVVMLQKTLDEIGYAASYARTRGRINDRLSSKPWAVIASEITKGPGKGIDEFPPNDMGKWKKWVCDPAPNASGAFLFAGSKDLDVGLDHSPWENHYRNFSRLIPNSPVNNALWSMPAWSNAGGYNSPQFIDLLTVPFGKVCSIESRGFWDWSPPGVYAKFQVEPLDDKEPWPLVDIRLRLATKEGTSSSMSTGVFGPGVHTIFDVPSFRPLEIRRVCFDVFSTVKGGARVRLLEVGHYSPDGRQ